MKELEEILEKTLLSRAAKIPSKDGMHTVLAVLTAAYGIIQAKNKFPTSKQISLIAIRVIIDCCCHLQLALLTNNKDRFYKHFLSGKPNNQFKMGKLEISDAYLRKELGKRFEGIDKTYREASKGIHPSNCALNEFELVDSYVGYLDYEYEKWNEEFELMDYDLETATICLLMLTDELIRFYNPDYQYEELKELKFMCNIVEDDVQPEDK